MPITYPLSIPTTPGAAGLERFVLSGAHAVGVLRSPFTFMTQVQAHPGEAWMLEASVAPCRKEQAEPWVAFFASLRGPTGTFLIGDPNRATPLGAATGAPKVSGANAVRATSLNTKGWTNSVTNILMGGRLHSDRTTALQGASERQQLRHWHLHARHIPGAS